MKLLGKYRNGNYNVLIFDDGTKIRHNKLNYFESSTVESFDFKITNKCDMGCKMCHENSTPDGKHGKILDLPFLENLHPYTEIAIGGGNPLEHPDLEKFLQFCKEKKFIPSMTINQKHFEEHFDYIKELTNSKLVYGLGVSLVNPSDEFINKLKQIPNVVVHVINGIVTISQLQSLANIGAKILVLGYKTIRRGETLYDREKPIIEIKKTQLKEMLPTIIKENWFKVISFDNLALNQLDVKNLMPKDRWDEFYMGDDGIDGQVTSASMFIDAITGEFALNSCAKERFPIMNTIEEMYAFLKQRYGTKAA